MLFKNKKRKGEIMDNKYRRDHEMAYYSDDSVIAEQLKVKRIIREYNAAMPFDPQTGKMLCLVQMCQFILQGIPFIL